MVDNITWSIILGQIGVFLVIPILIFFAWNLWMNYINTVYLRSIEWIMLEIIPPKEVLKSPEAMELVLNALFGGAVANWYDKYWNGKLSEYYSLEIVSIEGRVHYYVRFNKKFRKVFEAFLYAQYPQAEVREAEDYTQKVPPFSKDNGWNIFAYNIGLTKDEVYPIKSYIDFGMDKAVGSLKENEKIDPMTPMLEVMGSIGIGEQIWFQIVMRADTKRFVTTKDGIETAGQSWKKKADEVANTLRKNVNPPDKDGKVSTSPATRGQLNMIEAIERHKNKNAFECGIRAIYVAKKENFNGNTITAFLSILRQFANDDLNSFKMSDLTGIITPWDDLFGTKLIRNKSIFLDSYKNRTFFYGGMFLPIPLNLFKHPSRMSSTPFIMSTEELATIFHLPGTVVETPTFTRLDSVKAEPPSNLPM